MALTIAYDGYGVIANADADTNDTGGTGTGDWKELGGGTVGLNPDVYIYAGASPDPASMGSKYASKAGYSYIDGGTSIGLNTGGNEEGELIWMWVFIAAAGAFDTLANHGFSVFAGNTVQTGRAGNNYQWRIAGGNDSNGWTGGWKLFVVDPANTGDSIGSPSLTGVDTFGVWIDTASSVRADSIFQSQIMSAKGLTITGTTTTNGWDEVAGWCTDYDGTYTGALPSSVAKAAGMVQVRGSTYFCIGSFTIGNGSTTTSFSASGNNIEFEACEYWNGTAWVTTMSSTVNSIVTTAAASLDWTNVSVSGVSDNKLLIDTDTGNASSLVGGTLKLLRSISTKSTDTFDGVVFSVNDTLSLGAGSFDNCTFTNSGAVTVSSTTSFSGNSIIDSTSTSAVITDDLDIIDSCLFKGDETTTPGHAVNLGTITGGTSGTPLLHNWTSVLDNGTTNQSTWEGSTQTQTAGTQGTANDAITVNVSSGSYLKIAVGTGATIPTVQNTGTGTLEITANEVTLTITVRDINTGLVIEDAMVYVTNAAKTITFINKVQTNASGQVTDTRSLSSAETLAGNIRAATPSTEAYTKYYKTASVAGTYSNLADTNLTIQMIPDQ